MSRRHKDIEPQVSRSYIEYEAVRRRVENAYDEVANETTSFREGIAKLTADAFARFKDIYVDKVVYSMFALADRFAVRQNTPVDELKWQLYVRMSRIFDEVFVDRPEQYGGQYTTDELFGNTLLTKPEAKRGRKTRDEVLDGIGNDLVVEMTKNALGFMDYREIFSLKMAEKLVVILEAMCQARGLESKGRVSVFRRVLDKAQCITGLPSLSSLDKFRRKLVEKYPLGDLNWRRLNQDIHAMVTRFRPLIARLKEHLLSLYPVLAQ